MSALRYKLKALDGVPDGVKPFYIQGADGVFRLDVQGFYELELALRKERLLRRRFEKALDVCERFLKRASGSAAAEYATEMRKRWPLNTRD